MTHPAHAWPAVRVAVHGAGIAHHQGSCIRKGRQLRYKGARIRTVDVPRRRDKRGARALKTMLANDIMIGMPTQPLMKPKDASVTSDGCCFSAKLPWSPPCVPPVPRPAPASGCLTAVPASISGARNMHLRVSQSVGQ